MGFPLRTTQSVEFPLYHQPVALYANVTCEAHFTVAGLLNRSCSADRAMKNGVDHVFPSKCKAIKFYGLGHVCSEVPLIGHHTDNLHGVQLLTSSFLSPL